MSSDTLQLIESLTAKLRKEFDERTRELEQERDGWKRKYHEQQNKLQALERFQEAVEVQAKDLVERNAPPLTSGLTKVKIESSRLSPPPSTLSSASSTEQYARAQKLERNYETLRRKYTGLAKLYQEAKRQNVYLKSELEKKSDQWRDWHDWWTRQKQGLNPRASESSLRPGTTPRSQVSNLHVRTTVVSDGKKVDVVEETKKRDTESITEDEIDETKLFRTTFSPDNVAARRDIQITPSKSHRWTSHPDDILDVTKPQLQVKQEVQSPTAIIKAKYRSPEGLRPSIDTPSAVSSSRKREVIEILESPDIGVSRIGRIPNITRPITPLNLPPATRPQSAPVQNTGKTKSTTPLSARAPIKKKKKEKEYPNMKYWTEDGTDGLNPLPPSPIDDDDGGLLDSLLNGKPPPRPDTASPLSLPDRRPQTSTPDIRAKTSRVRELGELESDDGSPSSAERDAKRQKGLQNPSESKLRRQILSPDLASKNKGRGRYAASAIKMDHVPRLGDFEIDPKKNQGVSHPFAEVVRGKEARRSLTATACPDCEKFYALAGPTGAETHKCTHQRNSLLQQVSKHRQLWAPSEKPPGFWNSDFPTDEEARKYREIGEMRQAEMTRQVAEEAARGDGRWKRKDA